MNALRLVPPFFTFYHDGEGNSRAYIRDCFDKQLSAKCADEGMRCTQTNAYSFGPHPCVILFTNFAEISHNFLLFQLTYAGATILN